MVGEQPYLSPRRDGETTFTVTTDICDRYEALEQTQFDALTDDERAMTYGLFADHDEIVHCHDEFLLHYPDTTRWYPGKHLPTFPEVKAHLLPVAKELMEG